MSTTPKDYSSFAELPKSIWKFLSDIAKFFKPGGSGGVPDVTRRVNASLTGKKANGDFSLLGTVAKIGLSIGFVLAVGKIAKNWTNNFFAKDELKTHKASAEEIRLQTETMLIKEQTARMLEQGHASMPSGQRLPEITQQDLDINPNARTDNAARFKLQEDQRMQYAGHSLN